ncbi:hypothetical protein [Companilactobacillus futsaii]|uniref:hypothetical protein n=1 Tax=Companilactobacillus futsaii TaxID=938155 RepID=UPI0018A0404E|nr:hypothetical protein [Companilactobacillus futsaii]
MFKRLSIVTVVLSGLLLASCTSQQSADLKTTGDKTEKTTSNTPKKSTKSNKTTKSTKSTDETVSPEKKDTNNESDSKQTQNQQDQTTNQTTTDQTQNQSDNQQQDQTQESVNLTTSQAAVEFLADKLSTTYDKSTTQYVANGKVTWNDVTGYQINIYSKNSDSPVGSYLVPANGQYFQIW